MDEFGFGEKPIVSPCLFGRVIIMNSKTIPIDRVQKRREPLVSLRILGVAATVFLLCFCGAAAADSTTPATLEIVDFTMSPATLMPGDSGTVSVTLVNTGTVPASINKASIKESSGIKTTYTDYYNAFGNIAPGNSVTITLPVEAGEEIGTFYPVFYIDFNNGMSYLKHPFAVVVDDAGVDISLTTVPESFAESGSEPITVTLSNNMKNAVTSVSVTAKGPGVSCKEGTVPVGTLAAGESKAVKMTVKTNDASAVILEVTYSNGANKHTETVSIPAGEGATTTMPELIVTNVRVEKTGSYYTLKADVNNAGFFTAEGLRITSENGGDVGPYSVYVVGSLDSDDLAGFELTFEKPKDGVLKLNLIYKDSTGTYFTEHAEITVSNHMVENDAGMTPVIIVVVIVIAAAAVFVVVRKKKAEKEN